MNGLTEGNQESAVIEVREMLLQAFSFFETLQLRLHLEASGASSCNGVKQCFIRSTIPKSAL